MKLLSTTSSSDGQLFGVQARTLYARINPHAPEKGASMNVYTRVADNLSPFYSRLIESTSGEAPYVLDGLLYHETDLRPKEHYSDTRGYTVRFYRLCESCRRRATVWSTRKRRQWEKAVVV